MRYGGLYENSWTALVEALALLSEECPGVKSFKVSFSGRLRARQTQWPLNLGVVYIIRRIVWGTFPGMTLSEILAYKSWPLTQTSVLSLWLRMR